ncbi:MAG: RluA family pseudouridine synthase [Clostridia bacterium]|nr:RluA family pseudouridine synthase [Clostridia bacterium]
MHEIKIGKNDSGQRLDKFIIKALPALPISLLYKSVRTKKIKINRHRADIKQILNEGDTLQFFLADEFFSASAASKEKGLGNIRVNLDIVYEDENILLINKRPGISVHEDDSKTGDTLLLHIQAYLYQKGEYHPEEEQSFAPSLCNRIDRNTGGIVIAAKNAAALRDMNARIKERRVKKYYLCVIKGTPSSKEALLEGFLRKDAKTNTVKIFDAPQRDAKKIMTRYRVLKTNGAYSLLEVELLTGRTHQIRAHLAHIGFPLLGDGKYGENKSEKAKGYKFQALWSYRLGFVEGQEDLFSYLDGKEFSVPLDKIYFVEELFGNFKEGTQKR